MDIKEKELVLQLLSVLFPQATIYLFGSRARKTEKKTSDIDIAIDLKHTIDRFELARAQRVLEALHLIHEIDLVDFRAIPAEMQQIILKEGVIWKQ